MNRGYRCGHSQRVHEIKNHTTTFQRIVFLLVFICVSPLNFFRRFCFNAGFKNNECTQRLMTEIAYGSDFENHGHRLKIRIILQHHIHKEHVPLNCNAFWHFANLRYCFFPSFSKKKNEHRRCVVFICAI